MAINQDQKRGKLPSVKSALLGLLVLGVIGYGIYQGYISYTSQVKFSPEDSANILPIMLLWNVVLTFLVIFLYAPGLIEWILGFLKFIK